MRWIAVALEATLAASGLAWVLVTMGRWPLDDRRPPASAFYALNGALGHWLVEHGEATDAGSASASAGREAASDEAARRGGPAAGQVPEGLTAPELAAARESLRSDPRFRGRAALFKSGVPGSGASARG
jgi:hypothetical protein